MQRIEYKDDHLRRMVRAPPETKCIFRIGRRRVTDEVQILPCGMARMFRAQSIREKAG
jgi:hypothetical protein